MIMTVYVAAEKIFEYGSINLLHDLYEITGEL